MTTKALAQPVLARALGAVRSRVTERRFPHRFVQLQVGLVLYGLAMALMVRANLGLNPWGVFHQGLSKLSGISIGLIVNIVGALLLLVWIPLRQRPGIGTISNILVIGSAADVAIWLLPPVEWLPVRVGLLAAAILLNGVATGTYIGAGLGPGPRDGLTLGVVALTGWQIRWVRMGVELLLLAIGWCMGGVIGVGTLAYALLTGPLLQLFLPRLTIAATRPPRRGTRRRA